MARYLILAQSEVTACALGAWLELLGESKLRRDDTRRIIWNLEAYSGGGESGVLAYEALAKSIEYAARGNEDKIPLNEVIALVDAVKPSGLSAIAEGSEWDNLVAMLILTFPEIHWVFGVITGNLKNPTLPPEDTTADFLSYEHGLPSVIACPRREPLFDVLGLRQWVKDCTIAEYKKQQISQTEGGIKTLKLPLRTRKAAAIDDEKCFAYFHGYTAFRFGYITDTVTSWILMSKLFTDEKNNTPHGFDLLLEDMSLNFPDKEPKKHIINLGKISITTKDKPEEQGRAVHFAKLDSSTELENSDFRILITTGHDLDGGTTLKRNIKFLKKHKDEGHGRKILKPAGGMLDLWSNAGLFTYLREKDNRRGNAKGFFWPPQPFSQNGITENIGHGAPGKLMLIAETLLNRAMDLLPKARTVQDYIQGAVLAAEAAELLSGMTPTLTLQALLLKHEFEAKSECAFVGVGYHFDVKTRAKEIEQEVKAIARWFAKEKREESKLHALVTIMNRLAQVFREAGRFEEEHECMVRTRRWHRQLVFSKINNPFLWAINGLLWYAEFLLASFPIFILAILLWLTASSMAWWFIEGDWKTAISGVWSAFFSGTEAKETSPWPLLGVSCVIVGAGFFHLGVLVAYFYSLISRR